jgi:hypothetical protein
MHTSRFFLFYTISLSIFSCSASENKQLIKKDFSRQVASYLPIVGRLANGEPGAQIIFDIATGAVNGLETVRQGYQNLSNSPTTQAVITNAQTGAEMLATHTYSAGVTLCTATHNLLKWAYNQRSQQDPLTFNKAVTRYNQQMYSIMYSELSASDKKECQQSIFTSLTTIKADISAITELINIAKGITENNSSGIRTTIIDHVIADITSDKKISEKKAQEYINIINEIAKFSKAEDGQNNLEESFVEFPIFVNDGEQLASELEKADNPDNNVFSTFIQKYMSNDSIIQAVLENKKNQNQKEIEKYRSTISTLTNEIQTHKDTIQRLKTENARIETEKCTINTTMLKQHDVELKQKEALEKEQALKTQIVQEKTALESKIQQLWTFIKIGSSVVSVSAIAVLMYYFKLYEQCMALLH